jgi:prevent-host-death family protein
MYNFAMTTIPATAARQRWAQTLDAARREPITITEHGRETVVVMDVELSRRALAALEEAQDAAAAAEAAHAIEAGEETVPLAELARELGFNLG